MSYNSVYVSIHFLVLFVDFLQQRTIFFTYNSACMQNLACLTCGQSGARTHTRHSGKKRTK